ncbi:hypothetical protein ACH5RR_015068 [Cinchona calisaya]|uniref:Reverse transcriptase zinc-binding domain-containing protein n=1 Tax=Cinchona calisaya TaxID=153742 RepID=A0ABD2ZS22_9GENT
MKCNAVVANKLMLSLKLDGILVLAKGLSGRLGIWWTNDLSVPLIGFNDKFIDVAVEYLIEVRPGESQGTMENWRGAKHTWQDRHEGEICASARLNRACGNRGWDCLFPDTSVHHVNVRNSDHVDININIMGDQSRILNKHIKRIFRIGLTRWSRYSFGHITRQAEMLRKWIEEVQKDGEREEPGVLNGWIEELESLLDKEDEMWRQRGKAHRIYEDRCIPKPKCFRVASRSDLIPRDAKVSFLNDQDRKSWKVDTECLMCGKGEEDLDHAIYLCQYAKALWKRIGLWGAVKERKQGKGELWTQFLLLELDREARN